MNPVAPKKVANMTETKQICCPKQAVWELGHKQYSSR